MELLLVRHAIAARARASGAEADARRRLTPEGRRRMARGARGLARLVPEVVAVVPSPLARALETARILGEAYGVAPGAGAAWLAPGSAPEAALPALGALARDGAVALVGHEPHLSRLAALLLTGVPAPLFGFRKGGACLLALAEVRPGGARLRWLATAKLLRMLGGPPGT